MHGTHIVNILVGHLCEHEGGNALGAHLDEHAVGRAKACRAAYAVPLLLCRTDLLELALPLLRWHDRPARWVVATPVLEADAPGLEFCRT